jgi:hypothetical protein
MAQIWGHTKDIEQDLILENDSDEENLSDSESEVDDVTVGAGDNSIVSRCLDKVWSKPPKLEILVVSIQNC